ncbi:MAG: hypothetical protein ACOCRK_11570 [bacterium]
MPKYRKKPIVIEAVQWNGNEYKMMKFCDDLIYPNSDKTKIAFSKNKEEMYIETLEGVMTARKGDYIIKGVNGEFYPCKEDIFEKTYERVE